MACITLHHDAAEVAPTCVRATHVQQDVSVSDTLYTCSCADCTRLVGRCRPHPLTLSHHDTPSISPDVHAMQAPGACRSPRTPPTTTHNCAPSLTSTRTRYKSPSFCELTRTPVVINPLSHRALLHKLNHVHSLAWRAAAVVVVVALLPLLLLLLLLLLLGVVLPLLLRHGQRRPARLLTCRHLLAAAAAAAAAASGIPTERQRHRAVHAVVLRADDCGARVVTVGAGGLPCCGQRDARRAQGGVVLHELVSLDHHLHHLSRATSVRCMADVKAERLIPHGVSAAVHGRARAEGLAADGDDAVGVLPGGVEGGSGTIKGGRMRCTV